MLKKNYSKNGFSLIELLVVVAIISVLAGVGVVGYQTYTEAAKTRVLVANYNSIVRAVEFELVVANNGLDSVIKEFDEDGNMIDADGNITTNASDQRLISQDTTCNNFAFSVKEHFKHFKNPHKIEWESVTVDTMSQSNHRKGQIQVFCYSMFGNFGNGGGCPISADACKLMVMAYKKDRGRWNTTDGLCDNTMIASDPDIDEVDNDCLIRAQLGGNKRANQNEAKSDCGWDVDVHGAWEVRQDSIDSDAGGRCLGSNGTPCT
jgi:prepilin-type N-terminal cleavage/methylation domain-containing protein